MRSARPAVLVIAGSDSSGGAGLQRDLRVLVDFDIDAVTAVTAVTTQSDGHLGSALLMPPGMVREQIAAALQTRPVAAVKIGMLGSREIVEAVADGLQPLDGIPIVLDPVLLSSSGGVLLDDPGREAMVARLFPRVSVLTPNLPEAAALLDEDQPRDKDEITRQAERLRALGPRAVLLKGGHDTGGASVDTLVSEGSEPIHLSAPRLAASMRGTGCALATAIAAQLALGTAVPEACRTAKDYVFENLRRRPQGQPS